MGPRTLSTEVGEVRYRTVVPQVPEQHRCLESLQLQYESAISAPVADRHHWGRIDICTVFSGITGNIQDFHWYRWDPKDITVMLVTVDGYPH